MKIRKKYIVAIIFSILSVVSLNSLNSIFSIIPQKRLPLEEDGTTISWTLAGVQGEIPDPVDISRIIDVTTFGFNSLINNITVNNDPINHNTTLDCSIYLNRLIQALYDDQSQVYLSFNHPTPQLLEIYFPPGDYTFKQTINLDKDKIIIRGAGSDLTTFKFVIDNLTGNLTPGNMQRPFIQIEGAQYSGIEDFKITNEYESNIIYLIESNKVNSIIVRNNCENVWITGIESKDAYSRHIHLSGSKHVEVSGCYIHGTIHNGGGGNGYGIVLGNNLTYSKIENNIISGCRHSLITSVLPQKNVVSYNYSFDPDSSINYPADICLHGHSGVENRIGSHYNLFEGNDVEFIKIDFVHGMHGENIFLRNHARKRGLAIIGTMQGSQTYVNNRVRSTNWYATIIKGLGYLSNQRKSYGKVPLEDKNRTYSNDDEKQNGNVEYLNNLSHLDYTMETDFEAPDHHKKNLILKRTNFWGRKFTRHYYKDNNALRLQSLYLNKKPDFFYPYNSYPYVPNSGHIPARSRYDQAEVKTFSRRMENNIINAVVWTDSVINISKDSTNDLLLNNEPLDLNQKSLYINSFQTDSGVTVNVEPGIKISVKGVIVAIGSEDKPISFKVNSDNESERWGGIEIEHFNDKYGPSVFKYCNFEKSNGALIFNNTSNKKFYGIISNSNFRNNHRLQNDLTCGGAIYAFEENRKHSEIEITNCNFDNNESIFGGALYSHNINIISKNNIFKNNTSNNGGAVMLNYQNNSSFLSNVFSQNDALAGGAIRIENCTDLILLNNTFDENIAGQQGNAIFVNNATQLRIINNIFWDTTSLSNNIIFSMDNNEFHFFNNCVKDGTLKVSLVNKTTFNDNHNISINPWEGLASIPVDFKIDTSSSCFDKGHGLQNSGSLGLPDNITEMFEETDINGHIRLDGLTYDIGASEAVAKSLKITNLSDDELENNITNFRDVIIPQTAHIQIKLKNHRFDAITIDEIESTEGYFLRKNNDEEIDLPKILEYGDSLMLKLIFEPETWRKNDIYSIPIDSTTTSADSLYYPYIKIHSTDYIPVRTLVLNGFAFEATIELNSPDSLNFRDRRVVTNDPYEEKSFFIKNTGNYELDISSIEVPNHYEISWISESLNNSRSNNLITSEKSSLKIFNNKKTEVSTDFDSSKRKNRNQNPIEWTTRIENLIIPPNDSLEVNVRFNPKSYGLLSGDLSIRSSNNKDSLKVLPLSGFGLSQEIDGYIDELYDFGIVPANNDPSYAIPLSFNIENIGTVDLTISSLELPEHFTLVHGEVTSVNRDIKTTVKENNTVKSLKSLSNSKTKSTEEKFSNIKLSSSENNKSKIINDKIKLTRLTDQQKVLLTSNNRSNSKLNSIIIPPLHSMTISAYFNPYLLGEFNENFIILSDDIHNEDGSGENDESRIEIPLKGIGRELRIPDDISSTISDSQIWSCPVIIINENITISSSGDLAIKKASDINNITYTSALPVQVIFSDSSGITVDGKLNVTGNSDQPMIFSSSNSNGWKGIKFRNPNFSNKSSLYECLIANKVIENPYNSNLQIIRTDIAKISKETIHITNSLRSTKSSDRNISLHSGIELSDNVTLNIKNLIFEDFSKGIFMKSNSTLDFIDNSKVYYQNTIPDLCAMYISNFNTYPNMSNNAIHVNENTQAPHFIINGGSLTFDKTWYYYGLDYRITENISIAENAILTISPGNKIKFANNKSFTINGRLLSVGTNRDSISFNTINTGDNWKGLKFINSNQTDFSSINYCRISKSNETGIYFLNSSNIELKNSSIFNNTINNLSGGGISINDSFVRVESNRIYNNNSGISGGGVYIKYNQAKGLQNTPPEMNSLISINNNNRNQNNTMFFERNYLYNNTANNGGGLYIENAPESLIFQSNIISQNHSNTNGRGLFITTSPSLKIIHNTIADNQGNGHQVFLSNSNNTLFKYNIIYHPQNNTLINNGILQYNLIYYPGANPVGTTNIAYDPDFVQNPEAGIEYSLQPSSPCIDAGEMEDLSYQRYLDFAGNSRINRRNYPIPDFGAHEFNGNFIFIEQEQLEEVTRNNERIFGYKKVRLNGHLASNHKLIIKPGVEMIFLPNSGLTINNEVDIHGSAGKPIHFYALNEKWNGISVGNNYNYPFSISYVNFSKAESINNGSALKLENISQNIILDNCKFSNNASLNNGGAVYISNNYLNQNIETVISNCQFNNNKVENISPEYGFGGAIYIQTTKFTLRANQFSNNQTKEPIGNHGGAVAIRGNSQGIISDSFFERNISNGNGGGIYTNSTISILNNEFYYSEANGFSSKNPGEYNLLGGGGAVYAESCSPVIEGNIIELCKGFNGGGLALNSCYNFKIAKNTLQQNWAKSDMEDIGGAGGNIYINSNNPQNNNVISNNIISNSNRNTRYGGGLYIKSSSTFINNSDVNLYNNLISNNLASLGGGIYCIDSNIISSNNTIVKNQSLANINTGGGIYFKINSAQSQISFTIQNSIITGNMSNNIYNNFSANQGANFVLSSNYISDNNTDPGFFSYSRQNYQLRSDATAIIDQGDNSLYTGNNLATDEDLAKRSRFTGRNVDFGCYEYINGTEINYNIITDTIWNESYITVTSPITVISDVSLRIDDNVTIVIAGEGSVTFQANANLSISSNVNFIGMNPNIDHLIFEGNRYNNFIFARSSFDRINLSSYENSSFFNNCNFYDSNVYTKGVYLSIENSAFISSVINANSDIKDKFYLFNSTFNGSVEDLHVLYLEGYGDYHIENTNFENISHGIFIKESDFYGKGLFKDNIIRNNDLQSTIGLDVYHSNINIAGHNLIRDGFIGIRASGKSIVHLLGNDTANYQYIRDNSSFELDFMYDSTPYSKYNYIWDEISEQEPVLIRCLDYPSNNYLEMYDSRGDIDIPSRYIPEGFVRGAWETEGIDPALEAYNYGFSLFVNEMYIDAIFQFKLVVETYPDSKWAKTALSQIMVCENKLNSRSYNSLKEYYLTIAMDTEETLLSKQASYLANYCNILTQDYLPAIEWYDNVLSNSPSYQDSIYAIIDLGFIFLLMEDETIQKNQNNTLKSKNNENTLRKPYFGKMSKYAPSSKSAYLLSQIELLNQLFSQKLKDDDDAPIIKPQKVNLSQNYPNPFNPLTQIDFRLTHAEEASLDIYNIKGQKILTLKSGYLPEGNHTVTWDGKDEKNRDVSSGIYFYRLKTKNNIITKKMLLLK